MHICLRTYTIKGLTCAECQKYILNKPRKETTSSYWVTEKYVATEIINRITGVLLLANSRVNGQFC